MEQYDVPHTVILQIQDISRGPILAEGVKCIYPVHFMYHTSMTC